MRAVLEVLDVAALTLTVGVVALCVAGYGVYCVIQVWTVLEALAVRVAALDRDLRGEHPGP